VAQHGVKRWQLRQLVAGLDVQDIAGTIAFALGRRKQAKADGPVGQQLKRSTAQIDLGAFFQAAWRQADEAGAASIGADIGGGLDLDVVGAGRSAADPHAFATARQGVVRRAASHRQIRCAIGQHAWPVPGDRRQGIQDALNEAKKMREEIASMKAGNEALMAQAREEREVLLKEARDIRDKEIAEAKNKAKAEAEALLGRAREDIRNEKMRAIGELKSQVAELSLQVAETILRDKLGNNVAQEALVDKVIKDAELRRS